jgi:hypothetical protein
VSVFGVLERSRISAVRGYVSVLIQKIFARDVVLVENHKTEKIGNDTLWYGLLPKKKEKIPIVDSIEPDFFAHVSYDYPGIGQESLRIPDRDYECVQTAIHPIDVQLGKHNRMGRHLPQTPSPTFRRFKIRSVQNKLLFLFVVSCRRPHTLRVGPVSDLGEAKAAKNLQFSN